MWLSRKTDYALRILFALVERWGTGPASITQLAAENDVTATDYGQATSDMSKYQILSQTGISALAQANQMQQSVLKLLQ